MIEAFEPQPTEQYTMISISVTHFLYGTKVILLKKYDTCTKWNLNEALFMS